MNDEIQSFSDVISRTFEHISPADIKKANNVSSLWHKILLRIKSDVNPNEGRNLADHSRVIDFKNGVLLIEADHPGWIELLQLHKKFILNGYKMYAKDFYVETLAFRLRGKADNLFSPEEHSYSSNQVRKNLEKRLATEEKALEKNVKEVHTERKKDLPPELKVIFEDLRKSMLTNPKK